jgi:Holliday junction resolvase RusA-like endonuclease
MASDSVSFFVPGEPRGKQRARSGQGRHYTPKETVEAERAIAWAAKVAMKGRPPFEGPLKMVVEAIYTHPASWSDKRKEATFWKTSKCDVDNIFKLCADALKGIVWRDDAQVVSERTMKYYGPEAGLSVVIEPMARRI